MSKYFECNSGCAKCCEDTKIAVEPTLEDIARISQARGISVVEFYDEALVASFVPKTSEVRAHFRMPCEYIEDGMCGVHEIKPIVCAIAPEDRIAVGPLDMDWEHCRLKPISAKRKKEIEYLHTKSTVESIAAHVVLYSPKIIAPDNILTHSKYFRDLALGEPTQRELIQAAIDIVNDAYRELVRERFEQFQEDLAKHGNSAEVLNARLKEKSRQELEKIADEGILS